MASKQNDVPITYEAQLHTILRTERVPDFREMQKITGCAAYWLVIRTKALAHKKSLEKKSEFRITSKTNRELTFLKFEKHRPSSSVSASQ